MPIFELLAKLSYLHDLEPTGLAERGCYSLALTTVLGIVGQTWAKVGEKKSGWKKFKSKRSLSSQIVPNQPT